MNVLCISASNTKRLGENSASNKVARLIKEKIVNDSNSQHQVEVLPLMDYNLTSCNLCGNCAMDSHCIYDDGFNQIIDKINQADAFFIVVPHYSPIPSKLIILFEKINEIVYASWIKNNDYRPPFKGKPVGIIGHGGAPHTKDILDYYHEHLITPVSNTLRSLSFNIVGLNEQYKHGAPFGLKDEHCIYMEDGAIFPTIKQDYQLIEDAISPLITNVMNSKLA